LHLQEPFVLPSKLSCMKQSSRNDFGFQQLDFKKELMDLPSLNWPQLKQFVLSPNSCGPEIEH